ncbi:MAG TPA: alpha/beta hydrolase [Pseudonocardiaceae bacterium]
MDFFQDGLRATHQGPPSHNTVLGHSYGSTVVGYAARDHRIVADDVIFVGSPGVGVEHATDLHLPPSHVWSSHAANDLVRPLGHPHPPQRRRPLPILGRALNLAEQYDRDHHRPSRAGALT